MFDIDQFISDLRERESISVPYLQRYFDISYGEAHALMEQLHRRGWVTRPEYGVEYRRYPLPYTAIRRVPDGVDPKRLHLFDVKWVQDFRGKNYLLFNNEWHVGNTLQNNEGLVLEEFGQEQREE